MREIKFRAWDKKQNKMIPAIHIFINGLGVVWENKRDGFEGIDNLVSTKDFDTMQYAGITDKNGVEIFEGDIVRSVALLNDHHQKGAIDISNIKQFMGSFCLCLGNNETGTPIYPFCLNHSMEVIGNIHQNAELLEV